MESHADSIEHLLIKKIRVVPIIDDNHHLVSVAYYEVNLSLYHL